MKRQRSSPRSTLPVGGQQPSGSQGGESEDDESSSPSNKVQRASTEPEPTNKSQSHAANTPSSSTLLSPSAMTDSSQTGALKCSLAPTCSGRGKEMFFVTAADMERHHATYHTHTCLEAGCGNVFPDARFLTLHQTECHDPLTEIRKERGERTFECFVETCGRKFLTPKARRLHLIEGHSYPSEYFFAITNKGVGGLLNRWGEGVSLVRGKWKERSPSISGSRMSVSSDGPEGRPRRGTLDDAMSTDDEDGAKPKTASSPNVAKPSQSPLRQSKPPPSKTKPSVTNPPDAWDSTKRDPPPHLMKPRSVAQPRAQVAYQKPKPTVTSAKPTISPRVDVPIRKAEATKEGVADPMDLDALTSTMTALSLVPRSIHFGRGKSSGLGHR